jgi:hypothetical protein
MTLRLFLVLGLASAAMAQTASRGPQIVPASQSPGTRSAIRFEDATARAGIDFMPLPAVAAWSHACFRTAGSYGE